MFSESMATTVPLPHFGCTLTRQELTSDGRRLCDICPFCESINVLSPVFKHPAPAPASTPVPPETVSFPRRNRWDALNSILKEHKKARKKIGDFRTTYSDVTWAEVENCFNPRIVKPLPTSTTTLPEHLLQALHQYLSFASLCWESLTEGKEAQRIHFIAPIIITVSAFFGGRIQILAEADLDGEQVHAHGHFEFVLKRNDKRICIVEVKKDDLLQGKTKCLLGCETLCDIEKIPVSYGIATNYLVWCFLKNEADLITEEILTVGLDDGRPSLESLRIIANKIISILE